MPSSCLERPVNCREVPVIEEIDEKKGQVRFSVLTYSSSSRRIRLATSNYISFAHLLPHLSSQDDLCIECPIGRLPQRPNLIIPLDLLFGTHGSLNKFCLHSEGMRLIPNSRNGMRLVLSYSSSRRKRIKNSFANAIYEPDNRAGNGTNCSERKKALLSSLITRNGAYFGPV